MDFVPVLATIILIATLITLIVAVASYFIFRVKERRREARAVAALHRAQQETEPLASTAVCPSRAASRTAAWLSTAASGSLINRCRISPSRRTRRTCSRWRSRPSR